jgi:hypothetical protein
MLEGSFYAGPRFRGDDIAAKDRSLYWADLKDGNWEIHAKQGKGKR